MSKPQFTLVKYQDQMDNFFSYFKVPGDHTDFNLTKVHVREGEFNRNPRQKAANEIPYDDSHKLTLKPGVVELTATEFQALEDANTFPSITIFLVDY